MNTVLAAYGLDPQQVNVQPHGSGHINKTYRVSGHVNGREFILQRINTYVFKQPQVIAKNHRLAHEYLARQFPDYFFLPAMRTLEGADMHYAGDEVWRLLDFVPNTVTLDQADSPRQAYEAAKQFGRFARMVSDIDLAGFAPTILNFHNLTLRFAQLEEAIVAASPERMQYAAPEIDAFLQRAAIAETYATLMAEGHLRDRLMHHDTKISNVLLREDSYAGVCVIDLDTLMPGKVISDLGDMVRTYVSPVSEEEPDTARVTVREDYYAALMAGYLSEIGSVLTAAERDHLFFAGQFMVYMQGIRFLADYLNGDLYYPIKYPTHNLNRARNQLALLECLNEKEMSLRRIIGEQLAESASVRMAS